MQLVRAFMLGAALSVLAATSATGQDVTGTWLLAVELDAGSGEATFALTQEDGVISGTYNGVLGEQDVTGTIEGDEFRWSFGSQAGEISFRGTVDGETMEGSCEYGQLGSGTFQGRKRDGND